MTDTLRRSLDTGRFVFRRRTRADAMEAKWERWFMRERAAAAVGMGRMHYHAAALPSYRSLFYYPYVKVPYIYSTIEHSFSRVDATRTFCVFWGALSTLNNGPVAVIHSSHHTKANYVSNTHNTYSICDTRALARFNYAIDLN